MEPLDDSLGLIIIRSVGVRNFDAARYQTAEPDELFHVGAERTQPRPIVPVHQNDDIGPTNIVSRDHRGAVRFQRNTKTPA